MLLKISHRTEYSYDTPLHYALQRLRLVPKTEPTQTVVSWSINVEGAQEEVRFADQFGNETRLFSATGGGHGMTITAAGKVETRDTAGISGPHTGFTPLWLFEAATPLTQAGAGIRDLSASLQGATDLDRLHSLMKVIASRITYIIGATGPETTAEQALAQGSGVCQDHAHVFIAAARLLGFPARYVSGYLMMNDRIEQVASHAWAEAYVNGLGWVAFDAANGIAPDERYVRLAVGRDYRDAMPVSGIRLGVADESLAVHITVEQ